MKHALTLLAVLYPALGLSAKCVNGWHEQIAPDITFQHKCNHYRNGERFENIQSTKECALLCVAQNNNHCSYNEGLKRCVVSREGQPEIHAPTTNVVLLIKFSKYEDPWEETCKEKNIVLETDLDQCKTERRNFQEDLEKCKKENEGLRKQVNQIIQDGGYNESGLVSARDAQCK